MKTTTKTTVLSRVVLLLLMLTPLAVLAQHVSETEARMRAQAFLEQRGRTLSEPSRIKTVAKVRRAVASNAHDSYYVFNVGDGQGFVIVSGDERTASILGYADSGNITDDSVPDGLRYLLDGYAEQMAWLASTDGDSRSGSGNGSRRVSAARKAISPLIETRWNQSAPYNANCPALDDTKTVTGCVATCMAQLMYYHKWPTEACSPLPGYTTRNGEFTLRDLPATTFSWSDMTATYAAGTTGAAADAVALLMQYCGWALQMNYNVSSKGGSSAYSVSIAEALKRNFNYDGSVRYAQRRHYSYQDWVDLIYTELANNRPVALGGQSIGGGHSFVCDGYEADDYFHINWGWGGTSDGYFRLSVLSPYEQGAGGSSTLDGFSYSQDAVIGVQPYKDTPAADILQLEKVALGSGTAVTFTLCSYLFGTNSFDYAVQMVDADGAVVQTLHEADGQSFVFNTNFSVPLSSITPDEGIQDGTYYIKVVSRGTGSTVWHDCYGEPEQLLTAVVSGGAVTSLTGAIVGGVQLSAATLTVDGDLTQGHEQQVTASVTGGSDNFHGNIFLRVNDKAVMGKTVDIAAGQTVDVTFSYTPTTAGDNLLALYTSPTNGTQIGESQTVTITASDAANTQTITVVPVFANLADGKFYGNAVRVTATVTNPSSDNSYASRLNCSLRTYNNATDADDAYVDATVQHKNIIIAKGGTTDVTFEYTGLELGRFYCLRFTYTQGYEEDGKTKNRTQEALITDRYEMGEGYMSYNADGSTTICPTADNIDGGDALCLDLRGLGSVPTITPSTNPNCLYLLTSEASTPTGLSGYNVVKGSAAETIRLTDGYDFYSPLAFTASTISYTRTFTLAANGTSGWNTLMLPFTVSTITCEGIGTVDWFHSATDTGKHFWLRAFTADTDGSAVFDYADELVANTPYIIAVPDDRFNYWDNDIYNDYQMTGRTVTFSGTDAAVGATTTGGVSGNHYRFGGHTVSASLSDIYALNADGSNFVRTTAPTVIPAFRAWLSAVSISSLSRPSLAIASPETTAVASLPTVDTQASQSWFTLGGQRLDGVPTTPGLYINNGRIVIIR